MPIQRYFRDMMTLLTHTTMAYDRNAEMVAKTHFGLETPPEPGRRLSRPFLRQHSCVTFLRAINVRRARIWDRSREHLGTTDKSIIKLRSILINSAKDLERAGRRIDLNLRRGWLVRRRRSQRRANWRLEHRQGPDGDQAGPARCGRDGGCRGQRRVGSQRSQVFSPRRHLTEPGLCR
jgi:hypothetical protein